MRILPVTVIPFRLLASLFFAVLVVLAIAAINITWDQFIALVSIAVAVFGFRLAWRSAYRRPSVWRDRR